MQQAIPPTETIKLPAELPPIPNASTHEKLIVGKLVTDLLAAGFSISVYDGEDFCLDHSTDAEAIYQALSSTDLDWLHAYNYNVSPRRIGRVLLIWGNDADVISDYSVSFEPHVAGAMATAEALR